MAGVTAVMYVSRLVSEAPDNTRTKSTAPTLLEGYRDYPAWVLLAEPGMGKTTLFKEEARRTGGIYVIAREILETGPSQVTPDHPLFIDALDEVRGRSDADSILLKIKHLIVQAGNPKFRIACRAADWFGQSDKEVLSGALQGETLKVLYLEPLSTSDTETLLRDEHRVSAPRQFLEQAQRFGVDQFLDNPINLQLLVEATGNGVQWPSTRTEIYELACKKLVFESAKKHRDIHRQAGHKVSEEELLSVAGYLCAALLVSGKAGIALDASAADKDFPELDTFEPKNPGSAYLTLKTRIFRPENEEKLVPLHRSVAEFLAARWLGQQIKSHGLPRLRALNLITTTDGKAVSDLRGLYAWLALQGDTHTRQQLIKADPLTVIIYGDVAPMSTDDKQLILESLRDEAQQHPGFHTAIRLNYMSFGDLADLALVNSFKDALISRNQDDASQSIAYCVLNIIQHGSQALLELEDVVQEIVRDEACWPSLRTSALDAWLHLVQSTDKPLALLDQIWKGQIDDPDDELLGSLLEALFPNDLDALNCLNYLRNTKQSRLIGNYQMFWHVQFPSQLPNDELPGVLNQLANRKDLVESEDSRIQFGGILDELVAKGVVQFGEIVHDKMLFNWLGIGEDAYGYIQRENRSARVISEWLTDHPDRYKAVLKLCYQEWESSGPTEHVLSISRLHHAAAPTDLAEWHLSEASKTTNKDIAYRHLIDAGNAARDAGVSQSFLAQIEEWRTLNPKWSSLVNAVLRCDISSLHVDLISRQSVARKKQQEQRQLRTKNIAPHLSTIQEGTAPPALLHQLALVWEGLASQLSGSSIEERFDNYCDNGEEVLLSARAAFLQCPAREDLPDVEDIIQTNLNGKQHYLHFPTLIGMRLLWDEERGIALPDSTLKQAIAFRLTFGLNDKAEWYEYLTREKPELIAEVLTYYAQQAFKSGKEQINGLYPLAYEPSYLEVAKLALPAILRAFPVRPNERQTAYLLLLLRAAIRYSLPELEDLIEDKLARKSLTIRQRVYWLAAGMTVNPERYETRLWAYINKSASRSRAQYLMNFITEHPPGIDERPELSAYTLGRLIELNAPQAGLEWPSEGGLVTTAMNRGSHIERFINKLAGDTTELAEEELTRLLTLPALAQLRHRLKSALYNQRQRRREQQFRFHALPEVIQVLTNHSPANSKDLAALTLDFIDEFNLSLRTDNVDRFKEFWDGNGTEPRHENLCRNTLMDRLRQKMEVHNVYCQREASHALEKRADIELSFNARFTLPIEIKRDTNKDLWAGLRSQLVQQYANSPTSSGYGIYLVFWFGSPEKVKRAPNGIRPNSPAEMKEMLEATLSKEERKRISVRVIDVSWPAD